LNNKDVVKLYGKADWNNLHPAIKEVLIDLQFRGDYTPETRKRIIHRAVTDNYFNVFYFLMKDRKNWKNVPKDRFERRVKFLLNFKVNRGQLTFDAALGEEGGRFHSRKLRVPIDKSGLTIGRGYDMKDKTKKQIEKDLREAGICKENAKLLSCAAGLQGKAARKFMKVMLDIPMKCILFPSCSKIIFLCAWYMLCGGNIFSIKLGNIFM
jgi:hypothetical protein